MKLTHIVRHVLPERLRTFVCGVILMLFTRPANACPVCFGDPDSDMAKGAVSGIIVLGIIAYGTMMGMVGVGVCWFVRARRLASKSELPSDSGPSPGS